MCLNIIIIIIIIIVVVVVVVVVVIVAVVVVVIIILLLLLFSILYNITEVYFYNEQSDQTSILVSSCKPYMHC